MKKAKVSIEPYFDPEIPNMGFEAYGLTTAPGSETTEFISKDVNGRYVTGLDTNALSIIRIEDEEDKAAKIKEIEDTIERLENTYGKGSLDARSPFWGNFTVKLGHTGKSIDPLDPADELLFHAIKAGGFTSIAPSLEDAKSNDRGYKFYLRQLEQDADLKIQRSVSIAKAKGILSDMFENDQHKMYLVSKALLNPNNEFTPATPKSVLFEKLYQFIDGVIVKDNKKATVKQFLDLVKLNKELLYLTGLVKDAMYFSLLVREQDGYFYNKETQSRPGKNEKEVLKFLENPVNQLELENLKQRVEAKLGN